MELTLTSRNRRYHPAYSLLPNYAVFWLPRGTATWHPHLAATQSSPNSGHWSHSARHGHAQPHHARLPLFTTMPCAVQLVHAAAMGATTGIRKGHLARKSPPPRDGHTPCSTTKNSTRGLCNAAGGDAPLGGALQRRLLFRLASIHVLLCAPILVIGLRIIVLKRILGPFPPAVASRPLLTCSAVSAAAIARAMVHLRRPECKASTDQYANVVGAGRASVSPSRFSWLICERTMRTCTHAGSPCCALYSKAHATPRQQSKAAHSGRKGDPARVFLSPSHPRGAPRAACGNVKKKKKHSARC